MSTSDQEKNPKKSDNAAWVEEILATHRSGHLAIVYQSENLDRLKEIRKTDIDTYSYFTDALKAVGINVESVEKAIEHRAKKQEGQEEIPEDVTQASQLIKIASSAKYFHTADGTSFADIYFDDGHRETREIEKGDFRKWLTSQYFRKNRSTPSAEALNRAIASLSAIALFNGPELLVFTRIAVQDNKTYVDLANPKWQAVEISGDGWKIVDQPPVRFKRKRGMLPLPAPIKGGSVNSLKKYLNLKGQQAFVLVVLWLVSAMRAKGPYAILILGGEQGTAKSFLTRILRMLIDPNHASLRSLPHTLRDLFVAANNGWLQAFDNLSFLPDWISDALCRIATGGGFAVRMNYTDDDEMLFDAMRPIILNGIENVAVRGDLIDRSIVMSLTPINDTNRQTEEELFSAFEIDRPAVLGALFDVMAHGINKLPSVKLSSKPRMADFCLFATACETAVWPVGTFMKAYDDNRSEANLEAIAASPLADAISNFAAKLKQPWQGTATVLLKLLNEQMADEPFLRDKQLWPNTPNRLSERLKRLAPALRKIGLIIERDREGQGKDRRKVIRIYYMQATDTATSPTSATGNEEEEL